MVCPWVCTRGDCFGVFSLGWGRGGGPARQCLCEYADSAKGGGAKKKNEHKKIYLRASGYLILLLFLLALFEHVCSHPDTVLYLVYNIIFLRPHGTGLVVG